MALSSVSRAGNASLAVISLALFCDHHHIGNFVCLNLLEEFCVTIDAVGAITA